MDDVEMDRVTLDAFKAGHRSVSTIASAWFGMDNRDIERSFRRLKDAGLIIYAGVARGGLREVQGAPMTTQLQRAIAALPSAQELL